MILTRQVDLNIIPGGLPLLIRASRNDASSTLVFSLLAGEGVLQFPGNLSASVRGGTTSKAAAYEIKDGTPTVSIDLDRSMTGEIGIKPFEIVLSTGDYRLVTATFYLDVR